MGTGDVPTLRVSTRSGSVRVIAEDRDDIKVVGASTETSDTSDASMVTATGQFDRVTARVPFGTILLIGTKSGSVRVTGRTGRTVVNTLSGKVTIDSASEVDVRVTSGRVRIDECSGACFLRCTSGSVEIGSAGSVDIHAKAGSVSVSEAAGDAVVRTVSGRVRLNMSGSHDADVETISGSVKITLPPRTRVALDAENSFGRVVNKTEPGDDSKIRARAVAGRITIDCR